jgi:hypothetical protein
MRQTTLTSHLPGRLQHFYYSDRSLNSKLITKLLLLFAAHTFFLWMFLASETLERIADANLISQHEGIDGKSAAYEFAAKWRHGMSGGWPLYMPGFFVSAIVTWFWSSGQTLRRLIAQAITVASVATLTAWLLSPLGSARVVAAFQNQTGFQCEGTLLGPSVTGASAGLYTLATWSVFVVASERALANRSFRPFLLPLILSIVLGLVRPMTLDDLTILWRQRVVQGDEVAIISLLLIPIVAVFLVLHRLGRRKPALSQ